MAGQDIEKLILDAINSLREDVGELNEKVAVLSSDFKYNDGDYKQLSIKLSALEENVTRVKSDVSELRNDLQAHKDDSKERLFQLKADSFPNSDMSGHKSFHEGEIERRKGTAVIKTEVISHILHGMFWAILVAVFWAVVYSVKEWIKR